MLVFVFNILLFSFAAAHVRISPEVVLPLGTVRGYFANSTSGRQYAAFEGIPYATPPVGELRFRESQPVQPWLGTWTANVIHKCIQRFHFTEPGEDFVRGTEDCLYVNIYSPNLDPTANMDVIFYIHSGAFMFWWGGAFGANIIMDRNVVYVSMNYRLGPLGFLSTEDEEVPGNNGLKDQLLALKWVNKYVSFFGGNPNSVTITGMSAGGASVHFHSLSPLSAGLFHRGMSQSGSSLTPWATVENSLQKAKQLAGHVGCPTIKTKQMVECLRNRPAYQIVDSIKHFMPFLYNPFSPFGAVVDKWSDKPFVPEHPYMALKNGRAKDIPWIFSHVESEGLYPGGDFYSDPSYLPEIENRWDELLPFLLDYNYTVEDQYKREVAQKVKQVYLQDQPVSKATYDSLIKILSDRMFVVPLEVTGKLHAASIKSPVYYYYFSYRGAHSLSEVSARTSQNFGTAHADDTFYVLSNAVDTQTTETDRQMSEVFKDIWTSFAKNSIPILPNMKWPEMSRDIKSEIQYVHIESPTKIKTASIETFGNRDFWESLPFQENEKLFSMHDEL